MKGSRKFIVLLLGLLSLVIVTGCQRFNLLAIENTSKHDFDDVYVSSGDYREYYGIVVAGSQSWGETQINMVRNKEIELAWDIDGHTFAQTVRLPRSTDHRKGEEVVFSIDGQKVEVSYKY